MVTLTVRHSVTSDARTMFRGIAKAWKAFVSGEWWVDVKARWGIAAYVRGVEATHGPHGWHPHIHALVLVRDYVRALAERDMVADRWRRIVVRVLGPEFEPTDEHGADVRLCQVEHYVSKLAFEVSSTGTKRAADGHRTPWDIARAVAERGDPDDVRLWIEWQKATYGRRQLTWSKGAREILSRDPKTDEECAADRPEPTDELLCVFHVPLEWRVLAPAMALLLDAAERGGAAAVRDVACAVVRNALAAGDRIAMVVVRDPVSVFYGLDTS
jgi:hypothetical protein